MNKMEINEFIESMEEMGDIWSAEEVERVYGDSTLDEAIDDRMSCLDIMGNIISTVINASNDKD